MVTKKLHLSLVNQDLPFIKKYTIEKDSYLIKVAHSISGRDINKNEPIYLRLLRDDKIDSGKSMLMPTFFWCSHLYCGRKISKSKIRKYKKR